MAVERRGGANSYNTTYAYDAAGNRRAKLDSSVRTTYSYDVANQLQTYLNNTGDVSAYIGVEQRRESEQRERLEELQRIREVQEALAVGSDAARHPEGPR